VQVPPLRLDQCNEDIIASALAAPAAGFGGYEKYPDLASKTAALLYALAKSQACADGNKRVALILTIEFLALNGSTLDVSSDELVDLILTAAASPASERGGVVADLTKELHPLIVPLTTEEAE
jgi:death on curing protein